MNSVLPEISLGNWSSGATLLAKSKCISVAFRFGGFLPYAAEDKLRAEKDGYRLLKRKDIPDVVRVVNIVGALDQLKQLSLRGGIADLVCHGDFYQIR